MAASVSLSLLQTRRFLPLLLTKVSGVFNDNFFKNSLVFGLLYNVLSLSNMDSDILITMSAGLLILPFFLFSALAGQLADKYQKEKIIQTLKMAEIGIAILGIVGLALSSVYILLLSLFLFGTQSAFLNPCKYALLPQHLKEEELVAGNGLISAGTFLSILAGTMAGGFIIMIPHVGTYVVMALMLVTAVAGYFTSLRIPEAKSGDKTLKVSWNIPAEIARNLYYAFSQPREIRLSIIGIAWFYFVGGTFLAQFPNYAKDFLQVNESVLMTGLILFSVGIAIGALVNDKLLKGRVEATYVPLASLGISLFSMLLAQTDIPATMLEAGQLRDFNAFFYDFNAPLIFISLFFVAFSGGLFVVPLNALIQHKTNVEHRARIMAASAIVDAAFMVISALLCLLLLKLGFGVQHIFFLLSIASFFVAIYICNLLPAQLMKTLLQLVLKTFFKVEVHGLENLKKAGDKAIIVGNHVSLLDAPVLAAFLPGKPMFAMHSKVAEWWWVKPWMKLIDAFPLDPTNPYSIKGLIEEVKKGKQCVIFPEGRLTTTGALMKIYEGPGMIADKAGAKIVPVRLDGVQFAPTSQLRGKFPRRLFPKIKLTILEPIDFEIPEEIKGRARRNAAGRMLHDVMEKMMFMTQEREQTLFEAMLRTKSCFGSSTPICEDVERKPMSYKKLILGSIVLGRKIASKTKIKENVGVLLPNSTGAVVTFFALQAYGRVPAMLNFSVGKKAVLSACITAEVKTIITSRKFIRFGKLDEMAAALEEKYKVVYLEDIGNKIGFLNKFLGFLSFPFAHYIHAKKGLLPDDPAVVLFTSGSEGSPKGVVLSHANLMSNIVQLRCRVDFNSQDVVFNCLPMFHSFGLTGGTILPILSGVKTFLYPSPLHLRIVPEMIYSSNATIMFGTDTFLSGYARVANPYDFYRMRYIFAGAEKVKEETRQKYMNMFGVRILEGYGATEASPVIAVNSPMHQKPGSVGRFLTSIEYRLKKVSGVDEGGRLFVKGPNIMLGYYKEDKPGELQPPKDGWHDTGDIVSVDDDGYVTIKGRAKRFAKIGGEMISLSSVEGLAEHVWPEHEHAVISIPDAKKGEQLVLFTTKPDADKKELLTYAQEHGVTELSVPKTVKTLDKLPVLGTGKIDYKLLETL
jgi:acyl-[acyl-carrier-protein]-phospholipid O-acyltransferase/long-chain-fatty-acid--[acyl-carrier-protein] ligase